MNPIQDLKSSLVFKSAFLIENPINLRYFTKSDIDTGILAITEKDTVFLTDSRYIESAKRQMRDIEVVLINDLKEQLKDIFEGVKTVFIETNYQTVNSAKRYEEFLPISKDSTLDDIIKMRRAVKTEDEIEFIKSAQKLTDDAFNHIPPFIKEGVCERDIALEIEWFMRKGGADGVSFDLIAISGENTSLPHGIPSDRKIKSGDFVTMDIGCKWQGYCSDMTRTVAVGFATDEMKKVYNTVLTAQKSALDFIKAGIPTKDADAAARDVIESAGYGEYFGHSTGHGVGLNIHEAPNLSPRSDEELKEGMVVTVEPGIYLPQKFGVRIEDMVVITKNGVNNLTKSPKELIIL